MDSRVYTKAEIKNLVNSMYLTKKQKEKINLNNLFAFYANYDCLPTFISHDKKTVRIDLNDSVKTRLLFNNIDELNGWLNGTINAIYQLKELKRENAIYIVG